MEENTKKNVRSIRTSDEVWTRFSQIAEEAGLNQEAALAAMMAQYELSHGSQAIPSQAENIETFQKAQSLLSRLYMASIEVGQEQRKIAQSEVAHTLESRERTIQDLQTQLADYHDLKKRSADMTRQLADASDRIAMLERDCDSLRILTSRMPDMAAVQDLEATIVQLRQEAAVLRSQVAEKDKTINLLMAFAPSVKTSEEEKTALLQS